MTPRRARRTPILTHLVAWLVEPPAPRRARVDLCWAAAKREALR